MPVRNPVLAGFHPELSVCRVDGSYYAVSSVRAYFPGIPVYYSCNLGCFTQLGSALDRLPRLPQGKLTAGEIRTPTIRHSRGLFYIVAADLPDGGIFIVTALDPAGPWSEPQWLGEWAEGCDPDLFFDGERCYYLAARETARGDDSEIFLREFFPATMRLSPEDMVLWRGGTRCTLWPVGPHLYKIGGWYYLLMAEGGAAREHSVCVARSSVLTGPYEGCPCNPILTHRHLGPDCPVACVGRGDLVDTPEGEWYLLLPAARPEQGCTLMGREAFLARVAWRNGWPVVNPGVGRLTETVEIPGKGGGGAQPARREYRYSDLPVPELLALCDPLRFLSAGENGAFRLRLLPETFQGEGAPACLVLRLDARRCTAETTVHLHARRPGGEAGLAIMQERTRHLRFVLRGCDLALVRCEGRRETLLAAARDVGTDVRLCAGIDGRTAVFRFGPPGKETTLADGVDLRFLGSETADGFRGCTAGLYAGAGAEPDAGFADFDMLALTPVRNETRLSKEEQDGFFSD